MQNGQVYVAKEFFMRENSVRRTSGKARNERIPAS